MRKKLTFIEKVSSKQVDFGKKIGVDLRDMTLDLASAKIEDWLSVEFYGQSELGHATARQTELAEKFGYDLATSTRREAAAIISDIMTQLNLESVHKQNLKRGVKVTNIWDPVAMRLVISSITGDGLCFFMGGNGKRAWARNLVICEEPT